VEYLERRRIHGQVTIFDFFNKCQYLDNGIQDSIGYAAYRMSNIGRDASKAKSQVNRQGYMLLTVVSLATWRHA